MYHSFILSASLLSFIPTVFAAGSAYVYNNCGFDVYYASVAQNVHANLQKLPASGYSERYSKQNVGISIKLATSLSGPVTQFEFTLGSPNIYYDISNIDGNPFAQYGTSLVPSMAGAAGYPTCVALSCPAGQAVCQDAYNDPNDVRTMVCPETSDLTFTLCPGGATTNSPVQSSPAKSSVVVSVPVTTARTFSSADAPPFRPSSTPSSDIEPTFSSHFATRTEGRPTVTFQPTSFRTLTTSAMRIFPSTSIPSANLPVNTNGKGDDATPTAVQTILPEPSTPATETSSPELSPTAVDAEPQTTAPTWNHSWSWGHWRYHHTHRAHASGFRRL